MKIIIDTDAKTRDSDIAGSDKLRNAARRAGRVSGRALVVALVGLLVYVVTAKAAVVPAVHVGTEIVLGHKVRVCSWNPSDARVRGLVLYSGSHTRDVQHWAKAEPRTRCAMNGGTYNTSSYTPAGNLWAAGVAVQRSHPMAPAVGFVGGRMYFGYADARQHGAVNVMNGLAYLVTRGVPITSRSQAPWTTPAQFSCGARGTDGWYGCFRSAAVQFRNGRVGLVEISLASMPVAARILHKMGAYTALTFDSGGSAGIDTPNHGGAFGSTSGTPWHRLLPDDMIVQRTL